MYNTGTILKTNCHNIPFCFHLAICETEILKVVNAPKVKADNNNA